jgi:hypothetical protein
MRAVEDAIARQVLHGGDLPTNLLELGAVSEPMLTVILAETFSLDPAPAGRLPAPPEHVLRVIPGDLAVRHGVFPLELKERTLVLATAEPLSNVVEDDLGFALDVSIKQLAAPLVRVRQAIAEHYGIPLDRRLSRLVAKLDGRRDPSPSALPPDRDAFPLRPPRPISIPVPSFGTSVPSTHPGEERSPRGEPVQVPVIPQSAPVPQGLGAPVERPGTRTEPLPAVPRAVSSAPPKPAPEAPPPPPSAESVPYVSKRPTVPGMPMIRAALPAPDMPPAAEVPSDAAADKGTRRKGSFTPEKAQEELSAAATTDAVLEVFFTFAVQFFEYATSPRAATRPGPAQGGPSSPASASRLISRAAWPRCESAARRSSARSEGRGSTLIWCGI